MITIDKGVPLPKLRLHAQYPVKALAVGDSFLITDRDIAEVGGPLYRSAKQAGFKITIRKVEGGLRVWRIG